MGDAGSLFLGYVIGFFSLKLWYVQSLGTIALVSFLILNLADTVFVSICRIRRNQKITQGGKDHLSHRLVGLGFTPASAVFILCLTQAIISLAGLLVFN